MDYVEHPTDQQIYNAGLSRAGYMKAYQAQQRARRLEEQRAANTAVGYEPRRSDRFMPAGAAGIPVSKNRLAEQIKNEQEEKLRTTYAEFVAFEKFETAQGRDAAARLTTLMGYNLQTVPRDFGHWLKSDEAQTRFMGE